MPPVPATTAQDLPVLLADDFTVTLGANMGDPLSFAAELVLDDIYAVATGARTARLSVLPCGAGIFRIAAESEAGLPGAVLHLDAALSFMSPDGSLSEAFLMVEVDAAC
ncbi:hypothetical protein AB2B41_21165 [Marimonas sp. MJW-29]|uniref:Uncharacterized protein n=1 Tax=Sulfitobacter sediminis TaxID=3234186 RepID=A0ABV3RT43_9RHOB